MLSEGSGCSITQRGRRFISSVGVVSSSTSPRPGPVRVAVTDLDMDVIAGEAEERQSAMSESRSLSYGWSSETTNTVGLLGEHAVAHYLRERATGEVRLVGSEANSIRWANGDVWVYMVNGVGSSPVKVEVKTTRFSRWQRNGPLVNAQQWQRLQADAIVWCVIADELPTTSVIITGWLPVEEARASALNTVINPHDDYPSVAIKQPLRAPGGLYAWARTIEFPPF